jgi:hypothetical protein
MPGKKTALGKALVIQSTCLSGGKEGQIPIEPMQITVWP